MGIHQAFHDVSLRYQVEAAKIHKLSLSKPIQSWFYDLKGQPWGTFSTWFRWLETLFIGSIPFQKDASRSPLVPRCWIHLESRWGSASKAGSTTRWGGRKWTWCQWSGHGLNQRGLDATESYWEEWSMGFQLILTCLSLGFLECFHSQLIWCNNATTASVFQRTVGISATMHRHFKPMDCNFDTGPCVVNLNLLSWQPRGLDKIFHPCVNHVWLMVWNMFYLPIYWGKSSQLTFIFFRGVGQPPIRCVYIWYNMI